ncbi:hypothetical protein Tco_1135214 [Tanacetum coccineum]
MPIFKITFSQDLDLLEQHLTKDILSQTDCNTTLTKLRTKFENAFNLEFKERMQKYTRFNAQSFKIEMICNMDSIGKYMLEIIIHQQRSPQLLKQKKLMQTQEDHSNPIPALNVDSLKVNLVVLQNTCSEKEDSNSETASSKSVKESSLDSATKDVYAIKYLHSYLQVLSKEDLKGTRHRKMDFQHGHFNVTLETESEVQDDSSRSGNDTNADDADIRPIYNEEPMVEVQLTVECNIFATGQHTEKLEIINEGHRFSLNKTSAVYEKTSPRSDLRWKPTGRIFKSVSLRWIPTGKVHHSLFKPQTSMSNDVLTKRFKPRNTMSTEVPTANMIVMTSMIELKSLFGPLFDKYFNGENHVVSKSFAVTTADASDKRQQQPDSTLSTLTLATTITADGNFDLLGIDPMIQPELEGSTHGHSIVRLEVLRVILFSIHSDKWKSFQSQPQTALRSYALSWKTCQGDSLNLPDHRYKRRCCSAIPAKSDSLPHTHTKALNVNHSTSRLSILNFPIIKDPQR